MSETGTKSYLDRFNLTERANEMLKDFLADHGFNLMEYGYDKILRDEGGMRAAMKRLKSKGSIPSLMVKFSPDYLGAYLSENFQDLFFIDTKVSITPVFFQAHINRIKEHQGKIQRKKMGLKNIKNDEITQELVKSGLIESIKRENIGEIEREAWFTYNSLYPKDKVAIIIAVPYNPNLILAEWVSNIKCLWCFKSSDSVTPWDCFECPINIPGDTFGIVVNQMAGGSGTPHTNIHLGNMRPLNKFLEEEFKIKVDKNWYKAIEEEIKTWDLNKPAGRVSWAQFNGVIKELNRSCPWLKGRNPNVKDENQSKLI